MGLDSLWVQSKPPGKLHKALPFEPPLCVVIAGIAVPEWAAAFRGQLYAEVVEAITGVSLFQEGYLCPTPAKVKWTTTLSG